MPLTDSQLKFWHSFGQTGGIRVTGPSVRISGLLDINALRRSLESVVLRHESLRTRVVSAHGLLTQCIDAGSDLDFDFLDLGGGRSTNATEEAYRLAEDFRLERIDLSIGPLFSAKLLRLSEREHRLLIGMDHMVSDAASCGVLNRELWWFYDSASRDLPLSMRAPSLQFADYAVWESLTREARRQKHEPYWNDHLRGAPPIALPFDNVSHDPNQFFSTITRYPLGTILSAELRSVAAKERAPLSTVVLGAVAAVLSRWCRQTDFVVSFALHGRHGRPLLSNMIGLLARRTYLRIQVAQSDSFVDLLRRINRGFVQAIHHSDFVPDFEGAMPFNWVPTTLLQSDRRVVEGDATEIQPLEISGRTIPGLQKFLIGAESGVGDAREEIIMVVIHGLSSFLPESIESLCRNLKQFATQFTRRPSTTISALHFEP